MVPTCPRRQKTKEPAQEEEKPTATRQRVGLTQILQWVGKQSGIDEDLYASVDTGTAQKILTLAHYWLANGGHSLPHIEKWQITHPTPYADGLSESTYQRLFSELGPNESARQKYFKNRAARLDKSPSIAFDSTTISTYSKQQIDARRGFNKAGDGLDTVKLLTLYSVKTQQPIAFAKQPGNLPDVTSVSNTLRELNFLDLKHPLIVTDNGYYSQQNITEFTRNHSQFLTLGNLDVNWIREQLESHREELETATSICPWDYTTHGITVTVKHEISWSRKRNRGSNKSGEEVKEEHRYYLHFFLNRDNVARDERRLIGKIMELKRQVEEGAELTETAQKQVKKYLVVSHRGGKTQVQFNEKAIREARKDYGYFVLVSNKTMNCFDALRDYRLREKIEEAFKVHKDCLDGTRTRVWTSDSFRGRMFVQFVGLGYYCFLRQRIRQLKATLATDETLSKQEREKEQGLKRWLQQRSLGQILDWFDCVGETTVQTKAGKERWSTESTERDRLFMEKLGIK